MSGKGPQLALINLSDLHDDPIVGAVRFVEPHGLHGGRGGRTREAPDGDPEPLLVSFPEQAGSSSNPTDMARAAAVNGLMVRLLRAFMIESSIHPGPSGQPPGALLGRSSRLGHDRELGWRSGQM